MRVDSRLISFIILVLLAPWFAQDFGVRRGRFGRAHGVASRGGLGGV